MNDAITLLLAIAILAMGIVFIVVGLRVANRLSRWLIKLLGI